MGRILGGSHQGLRYKKGLVGQGKKLLRYRKQKTEQSCYRERIKAKQLMNDKYPIAAAPKEIKERKGKRWGNKTEEAGKILGLSQINSHMRILFCFSLFLLFLN